MSQVVTSTTHHWPSGDTDGGPTRLTFQRSSTVSGRLSHASSAPEAVSINVVATKTPDFMTSNSGGNDGSEIVADRTHSRTAVAQ
jgi:hypothetical protein